MASNWLLCFTGAQKFAVEKTCLLVEPRAENRSFHRHDVHEVQKSRINVVPDKMQLMIVFIY